MGTVTTVTIRVARPDEKETEAFWRLFRAANRLDTGWYSCIDTISEELSNTDLSRAEKLFILRAWKVLVDGIGGFSRLMGAFDTYVYNIQDTNDKLVAYKPEILKAFEEAELLPVLLEAYNEARKELQQYQNK